MPTPIFSLWPVVRPSIRNAPAPGPALGPFRRGPVLWLILSGVLLVAAITLGTVVTIGQFRERALSNSERELANTVLLLTRHFDQQFEDSNLVATDLIARMQAGGDASPERFSREFSSRDAHLMLRSRASAHSYVGDIDIYDSDGLLINSSATLPLPAASIAERDYFSALRSGGESNVMLSEPVAGPANKPSAAIAHRLNGPEGVFLGVMRRRIDPANFEAFFASVVLARGAAISMFHHDGTLLARYPRVDSMIGRKLKTAPLLQKVWANGSLQTLRFESAVDQLDRLGSAAPLSRLPVIVVATTTVAAVLADWQAQIHFMIGSAVMSALVIALILFLIVRQVNRQHRQSQQQLESEKHRLDTALNNMTQGLVQYDKSAHLVLCNQRYIDMCGVSTDVVKPGCHFVDVIRHRQQIGSFDGNVEEFCSRVMQNLAQGKETRAVMESPDGRSFQVVNKPLA